MQHQTVQENTLQHIGLQGPGCRSMPLAPSATERPPSCRQQYYSRLGEWLKVRRQFYAVDFIVSFILQATFWKTMGIFCWQTLTFHHRL